jgi:hypothetical protein
VVTPKTASVVWARAAGRCHYPGCNKSLIGDLIAGNEDAKFGMIAHIVAETPTGPRGAPIRSNELADDPSNLMLLCYEHHRLIDVYEVEKHPEQRLRDIKALHEGRISIVTDLTAEHATHVLRYGAKIGAHDSSVSYDRVKHAVLPERYPAGGTSIGIEVRGSVLQDGEEKFWSTEPENLRRQFDSLVRTRIANGEINHISVFGLAPIPLLIELGHLLGDITPADVYQLHREPAGWRWAGDGHRVQYKVNRPQNAAEGIVALKLGLSATISDARITAVLGANAAIWSLEPDIPHNDLIRHPDDVREFRTCMRKLYDQIKATHGSGREIHVFPAIPVSAAIEMGRVRMPKADLPLWIYDELPDRGFVRRLKIE